MKKYASVCGTMCSSFTGAGIELEEEKVFKKPTNCDADHPSAHGMEVLGLIRK